MRRSGAVAFGLVFIIATLAVAACSLDDGGAINPEGLDGSITGDAALSDGAPISPDGSTRPGDASSNDSGDAATVVDAGSDAGPTFLCGAAPVANCTTDCPAAPLNCLSSKSCVASCFSGVGCAGNEFECDACGSDGGVALSRCEPEDASAYAECLSGLDRCACAGGNVALCPGTNQTCENNQCFECAEPDGGNQIGHACERAGKTCHADGSCQ